MIHLGLEDFESIADSTWWVGCPFIILFTNVSACKEKLARSPLGSCFPDYRGPSDVHHAANYFFQRLSRLNKQNHDLYPYLIDAVNEVQLQRALADAEEALHARSRVRPKICRIVFPRGRAKGKKTTIKEL
jgi:guanine nucleotide-binding protein G(i) subunit alpha